MRENCIFYNNLFLFHITGCGGKNADPQSMDYLHRPPKWTMPLKISDKG